MVSLTPIVVECDRPQLLVVGDLTWPDQAEPSVDFDDEIEATCSLLPNLEGSVLAEPLPALAGGRQLGLWNSPTTIELFRHHHTRVVGGANNHVADFVGAVEASWHACRKAGITVAGTGPSTQEAARPIRLMLSDGTAILLYFAGDRRLGCRGPRHAAWGTNLLEPARDVARLELLRTAFPDDLLVSLLHWGWELQEWPEPGQRCHAGALAEAGVDVLIGHHAHVCQAWESIGGMTAFYGLGNFLLREGTYVGIDLSYPAESRRSAGIVIGAGPPRVVEFRTDSRGGVVTQLGPPVAPRDSFLNALDEGVPERGSREYAAFYRERKTVAWWYPVWSGDESRAGRVLASSRLRGVAALKRLRALAKSRGEGNGVAR